jgi:hypothetical protein
MNLESSTPIHVTPNNTPGQPITPFGAAFLAFFIGEHTKNVHLAEVVAGYSWVHILIILVPTIGFVAIYLLKQSIHSLNGATAWIENAWTTIGEFKRALIRFIQALVPPRFRPGPKIGRGTKIAPVASAKNQRGQKKTSSSRTSGSRRSI